MDTGNQEKRWAKRMDIDARIKLKSVKNNRNIHFDVNKEEMEVEVTNISKGGMGFKTEEFLPLNSYSEAKVVLWTRESFDAIIEIVRMENDGTDEKNTYGCRFVGLSPAEQFKIDVYQIVSETSFN